MKDQYKSNKRIKKKGMYTTISLFFIATIIYIFPDPIFNFFAAGKNVQEKITLGIQDSSQLFEENQDLKARLAVYENPGNLFFFYKDENKKLKEQLGYLEFAETNRKKHSVLNSKNLNIYKTFLIHDTENMVGLNDLVFYKFNLLIGKIISKAGAVAQIQLFSQAGVKNKFHMYNGGVLKMEVEGIGQGSGVIRVDAPRDMIFENTEKVFLADKKNSSYLVAELVDQTFKTQDTNRVLYFKIFANTDLLSQVEVQSYNNPANNEQITQ